ncbi:MAG: tetratricopeptide repeat protein [Deltaproteobacteria bacterium]|nr:tetratricopeptide repeat protein [Deltaproteobacteria bacterium]
MYFEEQLIQDIKAGNTVSLEKGLLIISGLHTEGEIETYKQKLAQIHKGFIERLTSKSPLSLSSTRNYMRTSMAKWLFEYLWNTKPRRCNGNFLLKDVIDAQLSPNINQKVGSCVGLTSLYTVLGLREGLNLTILVSGSHVVNRLTIDSNNLLNIDNTDSLGFDCQIKEEDFLEYPPVKLIANVLNSRGMAWERADNLERAKEDYEKAIEVNPDYANAYNNRGNIKSKQRDYGGAVADYNRAIGLNGLFVEAHFNRGIARENLGDLTGTIQDFSRAIELDSEYGDAYFRRGNVKERLGDYAGALSDFDRVLEIDPESANKVLKFRDHVATLKKATQKSS